MMATSGVHGPALILGAQPRQVNEGMRQVLRLSGSPAPRRTRDETNLAVSDRLCVFMGGTFMRRLLLASVLSFVIPAVVLCQTSHRVAIRAGNLIDGKSEKVVENIMIVVEG